MENIIIVLTLRVTEANIANRSPANPFWGVDLNLKLFAWSVFVLMDQGMFLEK